jgi:hypothetical protein
MESQFDRLPIELVYRAMLFVPQKEITILEEKYPLCKNITQIESFWMDKISCELASSKTHQNIPTIRERYERLLKFKAENETRFVREIFNTNNLKEHLLNNESLEHAKLFLEFSGKESAEYGFAISVYDIPAPDENGSSVSYTFSGLTFHYPTHSFVSFKRSIARFVFGVVDTKPEKYKEKSKRVVFLESDVGELHDPFGELTEIGQLIQRLEDKGLISGCLIGFLSEPTCALWL